MNEVLDVSTVPRLLALQFRWAHRLVVVNCDGLSHADSLLQPEPSGNCLNWIVGHIVASRQMLLPVLGAKATWSTERMNMFGRHSDPIVDDSGAVVFEELQHALDATHSSLLEALPSLEDADLGAPAPFSTGGRSNETLGSLVAGFAFHEAYHAGQISPLRRRAGHEAAFR